MRNSEEISPWQHDLHTQQLTETEAPATQQRMDMLRSSLYAQKRNFVEFDALSPLLARSKSISDEDQPPPTLFQNSRIAAIHKEIKPQPQIRITASIPSLRYYAKAEEEKSKKPIQVQRETPLLKSRMLAMLKSYEGQGKWISRSQSQGLRKSKAEPIAKLQEIKFLYPPITQGRINFQESPKKPIRKHLLDNLLAQW